MSERVDRIVVRADDPPGARAASRSGLQEAVRRGARLDVVRPVDDRASAAGAR